MMKNEAKLMKNNKQTHTGSAIAIAFTLLLAGCMSTDTAKTADAETNQKSEPEQIAAEETTSGAENEGDATAANADEQVKQLEQQLATMKIEWDQQKPVLERLVTNEADLQFLVQALADMSQLADEPSRDQYLGQEELSPEKRQQSLQALQSLVTSQEELNTLLVDLSNVVTEIASNSQNISNQNAATQSVDMAPATSDVAESDQTAQTNLNSDPSTAMTPDAGSAAGNSSAPVVQSVATESTNTQTFHGQSVASQNLNSSATGPCDCSPAENNTDPQSDPARQRDPSWYAMTTPYAEATPAGSNGTVSQLDSGAASGQPIPGLQVKTFKRRTLPSELAAAGADMQQYAMAPQFHMSRKSLSDYVSQLAFKLAGNQQLAGNRIGVASFVFFDEQLEQTSSVGNQLAEELSTVLPNYGARVIEYKLTREITVSPTGDLSLSRNTQKLRDSQGMDYVLTGTMVPTRRGLQINSRVVSTRDNVVIASATTLIPAMVLQQL
jgi:TolB-like protein